ncbi:putative serine/threonine-protein kinase WNK4 [Sesamum alatum]|uniref:non-specific serine/threonine protein kinase n=1 Tax=Sesamum alatum TaxID=300844 RepID=A0AAE1XX17_9LAMI|nr:putative serine/threonine-protein kinase WNK4 [Sesamum alatum]
MDSEGFQKPGFGETDVAERSPCRSYARYKKILGRGAFKDVYKGFDQVNNMEIAWNQICVDDESTLKSPENQESLCAEAVLLNSLNHRNIMKCYSYWVDYDNKSVNMITELFSSGSMRQYMKKLGGVDIQTIKNWGRQILQGLEYLIAETRDARVLMAPEYYDEEYNEPSAVELLEDPFFSTEIQTEIEHNSRGSSSTTSSRDSSLTVAEMDESPAVSSSSLEVDFGVDSRDQLVWNEDQYLGGERLLHMNRSTLSEISAFVQFHSPCLNATPW